MTNLFSTTLIKTYHAARRLVVAVVGTTVILIGLALIFLPGPAVVVIPTGIAILGLEFAWARKLLRRMRNTAGSTWDKVAEATFKSAKNHGNADHEDKQEH